MLTIHIGMPKTGTTACQHVLDAASAELLRCGVLYPPGWRSYAEPAHHALPAELLRDRSLSGPEVTSFLAYVAANAAQDILISSEAFTNTLAPAGLGLLSRFLEACSDITPTRLVIALRRMDTFFESMYLHAVKVGPEMVDFPTYLNARENWAANLLRGIAEIRRIGSVTDISILKYDVGDIFQGRLMEALLTTEKNVALPNPPRLNARLGLKAHSLLLHLAWFSEQRGIAIKRGRLIADFEDGRFSFDNEIYSYSIMNLQDAARLHQGALIAARKTGITEYADFFGDDELRTHDVASLDRANLSSADLIKLAAFLTAQLNRRKSNRR